MTHSGSPSLYTILEESPSEDDSALSEGERSGSPLPRVCNTVMSVVPITTMPPLEETAGWKNLYDDSRRKMEKLTNERWKNLYDDSRLQG
jgi:hypothetical protein